MAKRGVWRCGLCIWSLVATFAILQAITPPVSGQTPTPSTSGYRGTSQVSGYQGEFADLAVEIDRFWAQSFADNGRPYAQPNIVVVDRLIDTACGPIQPVPNAFYCSNDRTMYLVPQFLADLDATFGDFAPITVLGHEWGHHIQELVGIRKVKSVPFELQADCLTGVFARHAQDLNLLDADDLGEAIDTAIGGGDPIFVHEDEPDAHGSSSDRVIAFMAGYYEGPTEGCDVPLDQERRGSDQTVDQTSDSDDQGVGSVGLPLVLGAPLLPTTLPLSHAACFSVVDGGPLTFSQLLDRFSGSSDASDRLQEWGWQASAYRQFGCDGPPEGEAGWIDISVHGFGSASSAQEAADYFAAARMDGTSLVRADGPGIGDYSVALVGPAKNGKEFTIYATRGPWLVRVTGVSPSGIPFMDVRAVATDVLAAQELGGTSSGSSGSGSSPSAPGRPSSAYLPNAVNLNYASCFRTYTSGSYGRSDVGAAFSRTSAGQGAVDTYGWQDGAYVVFRCDEPPLGHARQIEVIIHQFRDASAAQQIEGAVKNFHIPGDHESRACDTVAVMVICVSGYADTGSPLSDVYFVLNQVVAGIR